MLRLIRSSSRIWTGYGPCALNHCSYYPSCVLTWSTQINTLRRCTHHFLVVIPVVIVLCYVIVLITRPCHHFPVVIPVVIILTFVLLILISLHSYSHHRTRHSFSSYLVFTHHVYNQTWSHPSAWKCNKLSWVETVHHTSSSSRRILDTHRRHWWSIRHLSQESGAGHLHCHVKSRGENRI